MKELTAPENSGSLAEGLEADVAVCTPELLPFKIQNPLDSFCEGYILVSISNGVFRERLF